jgi:hypothetical protein
LKTLSTCNLRLLSGIEPSVVFKYHNGHYYFNKKFHLKHLNTELDDILKPVCEYSRKILLIRQFIEQTRIYSSKNYSDNKVTRVYEIFTQCSNEYLKYFHKHLHTISNIVDKKQVSFTLIDFVENLRKPYFAHIDILSSVLYSIKQNLELKPCQKSINLIIKMHSLLVDSYSVQEIHSSNSILLVWLFVHCLSPFLTLIDKLLCESHQVDILIDLGIKQNVTISLEDSNYWQNGVEFLLDGDYVTQLPKFIRVLLLNSFKISKNIQIIKILNNYKCNSNVNQEFCDYLSQFCPFLKKNTQINDLIEIKNEETSYSNLLELNFKKLNTKVDQAIDTKCLEKSLDHLFRQNNTQINNFNIETEIEKATLQCLDAYVNTFSGMLVDNLNEKFKLFMVFEQIHAYYFFKSNETMFVFSKNLFELIKNYETYQEDIILNNLFVKSFTQLNPSLSGIPNEMRKMFTFTYESTGPLVNTSPTKRRQTLSTRLVNGIKIKFSLKWPFNLVMNESQFDVYNEFYILFLQLKQVKYDLESCGFHEMSVKDSLRSSTDSESTDSNSSIDHRLIHRMYLIRFRLLNFICSVHDLICNQVYELSDSFIHTLKESHDLDTIIKSHQTFLTKLNKQSLKGIFKFFLPLLMQFIDIILRFGDRWRRGPFALSQKVIDDFESEINDCFRFLFNTLSSYINLNQQISPLVSILLYSAENRTII